MIQSMTGFGKQALFFPNKKISIEIISLNSKSLDLTIKLPNCYKLKELEIRKKLSSALKRGKVNFSIIIETNINKTSTKLDFGIVKNYIQQLKEVLEPNIKDELELLKIAIKMPDAVKIKEIEFDDNEWKEVEKAIKKAIENIIRYRLDEASALEIDIRQKIKSIKKHLKEVESLDGKRLISIRNRLEKSIKKLKVEIDEIRFEQEIIYYIEKLDINEEMVRLANHLDYFLETLDLEDSNGKKLIFIVQEMGREINTIGAKANYSLIQKAVIKMKDELEQVKEQIYNIL